MRFYLPVPVLFVGLMVFVVGTALFGNLSTSTWSVIAALMGGTGFFVYIKLLLKERHPLASSSWVVWVVLDFMCVIGNIVDNEFNGLVLIYTAGAVVTCIILLCRDGMSKWDVWDKTCTAIALVGVVLWQVFNYMPITIGSWDITGVKIGMFFAQVSGIVGSIPMWKKVWQKPHSESAHAWVIWAWSCIAGIMAISEWTFVKASSPVTFAFIEWVICLVMYYRRCIKPPHQ